MFEHNRSKKVELLAKVYDHTNHKYRFEFRMRTLGWSDGSTFLTVNRKNRINEAVKVGKRTLVTNAENCPSKKEHLPCFHF